MLPDRVSHPGPLTYQSGALPNALRGPANPLRYLHETNTNMKHEQTASRKQVL